jgi:nucleotide-binding universal stress UspA family protein
MFKKILAPVDGSDTAWKALKTARVLAEKFKGELLVVTVTVPYSNASLLQIALNQDVIDRNNEELEKAGKVILDQAREKLQGFKGKVSYDQEAGNAAETILDLANDQHCDAIVIGSRGLSGVEEFFLGSVSSKVSQYADVPVFIVK